MKHIVITRPPPLPEHSELLQAMWVGVIIKFNESGVAALITEKNLPQPPEDVYTVLLADALLSLRHLNKVEAAAYWQVSTPGILMFPKSCCELIEISNDLSQPTERSS